MSQWAEGRKMAAGGEKRRTCHPPSAQRVLSLFFSVRHFFPTTGEPFPSRSVRVCTCVCLSECALEVRLGAEAIKALLKHEQEESEKREEVRQ